MNLLGIIVAIVTLVFSDPNITQGTKDKIFQVISENNVSLVQTCQTSSTTQTTQESPVLGQGQQQISATQTDSVISQACKDAQNNYHNAFYNLEDFKGNKNDYVNSGDFYPLLKDETLNEAKIRASIKFDGWVNEKQLKIDSMKEKMDLACE